MTNDDGRDACEVEKVGESVFGAVLEAYYGDVGECSEGWQMLEYKRVI